MHGFFVIADCVNVGLLFLRLMVRSFALIKDLIVLVLPLPYFLSYFCVPRYLLSLSLLMVFILIWIIFCLIHFIESIEYEYFHSFFGLVYWLLVWYEVVNIICLSFDGFWIDFETHAWSAAYGLRINILCLISLSLFFFLNLFIYFKFLI